MQELFQGIKLTVATPIRYLGGFIDEAEEQHGWLEDRLLVHI